MNKSYTSLEQSKKLAKILPLESADMSYSIIHNIGQEPYHCNVPTFTHVTHGDIPCWSLSVLLQLIPSNDKSDEYYAETESHSDCHIVRYKNCWDGLIHSEYSKESLLDAAFEMVVWLKENKYI